jgi:hypothetical protein
MKKIIWGVIAAAIFMILLKFYVPPNRTLDGERTVPLDEGAYRSWQPNPISQGAGFGRDF